MYDMPIKKPSQAKPAIIEISIALAMEYGLTSWTVEDVSRRAGCAKGLVLYHFKTKDQLLLALADAVRQRSVASYLEALDRPPLEAIERLWQVLVTEARDGTAALRMSLLGDARTRAAIAPTEVERQALSAAIGRAFSVAASDPLVIALPASWVGFQVQILEGAAPTAVRDGFDAFWLGVLHRSDTTPM